LFCDLRLFLFSSSRLPGYFSPLRIRRPYLSLQKIRKLSITKTYGTVTALDGITLDVNWQEFFGLLGPNGAGKTTLMNLLVGYINPDGGTITIDGAQITQDTLEVRKKIGFVPQSIALYDALSALDNLEIFGRMFDITSKLLKERIEEQLRAVELYERRRDKVKTYSGGMKRRLEHHVSYVYIDGHFFVVVRRAEIRRAHEIPDFAGFPDAYPLEQIYLQYVARHSAIAVYVRHRSHSQFNQRASIQKRAYIRLEQRTRKIPKSKRHAGRGSIRGINEE
jgi:ABC-type uncharacterized transport system YnjBCD ATPase subunit